MGEVATRNSYTDAEVELGLRALAICSGNSARAAQLLNEQGKPIKARTLRRWKANDRYAERYRQVQADMNPVVWQQLAEDSEDMARRHGEIEATLVDQLAVEAKNLKPGDLPGALRNVAVSKAINIDKAAAMRGRPSEIKMELGVEELVAAIGRELGPITAPLPGSLEGSAAEIESGGPDRAG